MKIKHTILKSLVLLLLIQANVVATEAFEAVFIEPYYNFYGKNQYSVKGMGLGNTGVSYKNNISGSLNNPATLSIDRNVNLELVYLENRGGLVWNKDLNNLDQKDANYLIGIATKITKKLSAGIVYSIEKNIQSVTEDIPITEIIDNRHKIIGTADYIQELEQSSLTVPISYKIDTALSLGLTLKYSNFKLNTTRDTLSGSSSVSVFTPQFGVLFSPKYFISLGITYVPETKTSKGTMSYNNNITETVPSKTLPSKLGIGATLSPLNNLSISIEYLHRNYSKFSDLEDQVSHRAGVEYRPIESLALRLGYYSAPNYIKNPTLGRPDITQEFLTYGLGFKINTFMMLNVAIRDSSIYKKGDINKSQYLANIQVNY